MSEKARIAPVWGWLGIFIAALAAYSPALRAGFIWDDDGFVHRPDLAGWAGLGRIWFQPGSTEQYYPFLHSVFWLEHRLWGETALWYHAVNILLHAAAACFLRSALHRLAVPGAWLAAFLFALHPVGVESVAWIAEQKNTLSAVFYFAAASAYLEWTASRSKWGYCGATVLFVLAILSKSVCATLPGALVVAFWWRDGQLTWKNHFRPLVPWLIIGGAFGLFTGWVEKTYIGAAGSAFDLNGLARGLLAGRIVWFYLGKLIWPANLIFIYPRWMVDPHVWWQYLFPAAALGCTIFLWTIRRRTRAPLAAWLCFAGTLFPTLGFFNVYAFIFSYVADHWQYLACAAIFAFAAALYAGQVRSLIPAILILSICGVLTWRQARGYRDVVTFYRGVLDRNPAAWLIHDNLGVILANTGHPAEAMDHYQSAARLNPDFPQTFNNLGNALARSGRTGEALAAYSRAVALWPGFADAEMNWAAVLVEAGQYDAAEAHYRNVLHERPAAAEAEYGLGNCEANLGHLPAAVEAYRAAVRMRPDYAEAHANLGLALATAGQTAAAIEELTQALTLKPNYAEGHAYLGSILAQAGHLPEAAAQIRLAIQINPRLPQLHYQLAEILRSEGEWAASRAETDAGRKAEAGRGP